MRKQRQTRRVGGLVALVVAVFAVGLGLGAAVVVVSRPQSTKHVVVTQTLAHAQKRTPRANDLRSSTSARQASTSAQKVQKVATYEPIVRANVTASFDSLEGRLAGNVGLAVAPLGAGSIASFGDVRIAHAWSTSKVPVLVTLLSRYEAADRVLSPKGRTDATLALTESDNAAIEALFGSLEQLDGGLTPASLAVQQMFRMAGDRAAIVNTAPNDEGFTTYGQSEWSLRDEIIFYRAFARGCLIDPVDTRYVLGLMRNVIPSQRWGVGSAGYAPSVTLAFKGGWGPDSNGRYQVRQTAIVGSGNHGYVLTMIALPASGSFEDGTAMLTELATWARQHLNLDAVRPRGGCS